MGRKNKHKIKITEFPSAQITIPIRREDGSLDREKTFAEIDKQFAPKESPRIPYIKDIPKDALKNAAKQIQKEAKKKNKENHKEVKNENTLVK